MKEGVLPIPDNMEQKWKDRLAESEAFFYTMYPLADKCAEHVLKGKVDPPNMGTAQVQTTLQIMQTFMQLWVAMKLRNM